MARRQSDAKMPKDKSKGRVLLPRNVMPLKYDLTLEVDLERCVPGVGLDWLGVVLMVSLLPTLAFFTFAMSSWARPYTPSWPPHHAYRFVFDGDERVELEVQKETPTIVLHAKASKEECCYVCLVLGWGVGELCVLCVCAGTICPSRHLTY